MVNNIKSAQELRQRAAEIAEAAERSDDRSAYEKEMAEARRLRAEADRIDPKKPHRAKIQDRIQICVLCNKISVNQGWQAIERQMALCPECSDATPDELRLAGRRLLRAANIIERQ